MAKAIKTGGWKSYKALIFGDVAMLGLTLLAGLGLMSARARASETVQSQASVTVSSSCRLDATVDSAHEAEMAPSTYRENIGKTTISTTCNDANGYAVYAIGYTNTEFGRNDLLGANTGRTIETGTATSGARSNWAMKLSPVAGDVSPTIETGYQAYHAVPDEYTKVASYGSSTASYAAGSQFEATYAAFIMGEQVPDIYTGKVKYTLVHPADTTNIPCSETYTINYDANGGSGTMDSQTGCMDVPITLLPSGFTPKAPVANYQFGTWNTEADGSGYTYYARQSVTNLASPGEPVTLYAQWIPKYIQDLTPQICEIVAKEVGITVVDRRDGNDYTVRFLQDACWMTQNLRITGLINAQNSNFSTFSNVDPCEGDLTSGNSNDEARCHDSGNTTNGVWYNYAAASAKTIIGGNNSDAATEDICPAGWHLPNYDTTKPAGSIDSLFGMDPAKTAAFNVLAGGYYAGGSLSSTGYGYWWSSTARISTFVYGLYYSGSSLSSDANSIRNYGYYIRCVRQ